MNLPTSIPGPLLKLRYLSHVIHVGKSDDPDIYHQMASWYFAMLTAHEENFDNKQETLTNARDVLTAAGNYYRRQYHGESFGSPKPYTGKPVPHHIIGKCPPPALKIIMIARELRLCDWDDENCFRLVAGWYFGYREAPEAEFRSGLKEKTIHNIHTALKEVGALLRDQEEKKLLVMDHAHR